MWKVHQSEEEWGFLLIDVHNAFNEGNQMTMLWVIQHEWPAGARFMFNNYKHWATLMIQSNHGSGILIYSKEGTTQGCLLAMVSYGIMMLPLICKLKSVYPDVEQLWYADDVPTFTPFSSS
jgi:hypothetical protein